LALTHLDVAATRDKIFSRVARHFSDASPDLLTAFQSKFLISQVAPLEEQKTIKEPRNGTTRGKFPFRSPEILLEIRYAVAAINTS
jgi:hypothetical protein